MRICVMIEGQQGVTWDDWLALADAGERAGIDALLRSDHYGGLNSDSHGGSHDAWATICALAATTKTLRLGTLVSPSTFRHPSVLAKMAVTADHVSGSRIEVGLGAGWNEAEHLAHGFPFPPMRERMAIFAEQVEIVHRSWTEERFDFAGEHYRLSGAHPLPKPLVKPHLIIGGTFKRGTLGPAVHFADEYNVARATPEEAADMRRRLDELCDEAGRPRMLFSLMLQCIVGETRADVERRRRRSTEVMGREPEETSIRSLIGTVGELTARIAEYERAGVDRLMMQQLPADAEAILLMGQLG